MREPPTNARSAHVKIAWNDPKVARPFYNQRCWLYMIEYDTIFLATYKGDNRWLSGNVDLVSIDKFVDAWCDEEEISLPEWDENNT